MALKEVAGRQDDGMGHWTVFRSSRSSIARHMMGQKYLSRRH